MKRKGRMNMEKIASFTIDHIKLQPGVYVSRKDNVGAEVITTFDLRMTSPNEEPVMNTAEVHTIEHLAATFLRNHPVYKDKTIYFGPMGCRTGFYLLLAGDYASKDIVPLMIEMYEFIRDYKDEVPGASPNGQDPDPAHPGPGEAHRLRPGVPETRERHRRRLPAPGLVGDGAL